MQIKNYINKKYSLIIISIFVWILFFYVSIKSPIVGDAWNYAVVGSGNFKNALIATKEACSSSGWSVRFLSELYGFIVCSKHDVWALLNASLFMFIFIVMCKLVDADIKEQLLCVVIMLSVENGIRTQTYSWIMGTTYIIPLFLSLLYLLYIKRIYIENKKINDFFKILLCFLSSLVLFIICLFMQNIAATMLLATILINIYYYYKNKKTDVSLIINFIVCLLGVLYLLLSPGSMSRITDYHPDYKNLSLLASIIKNLKTFNIYAFINNYFIILLLSVLLTILTWHKHKNNIVGVVSKVVNFVYAFANIYIYIYIGKISIPHY